MTTNTGRTTDPLRIGMIGTRGVPAAYGGFETAIEEIGSRLAARGHEVVVHCRPGNAAKLSGDPATSDPDTHLGMRLVHLPAVRGKAVETLSHTTASGLHHLVRPDTDVNFVFNPANAPLLPLLRRSGTPVVVHVDGLDWQRGKWGPAGRAYYRRAEALAVRWADALIADAVGIQDYYRCEFGVETTLLAYGAPVLEDTGCAALGRWDLAPRGYHLVVARMEPENHVEMIVEGYHRSAAELPLAVVGTAPYAAEYIDRIRRTAEADRRIRLLGGVWDQDALDQLYANALTYVHGHSVGGTNPSLLRAMGAGASTLAYDVVFNREVLGRDAEFFRAAEDLPALLAAAEAHPAEHLRRGQRSAARIRQRYDWDRVAEGYERLARRVVAGATTRGSVSGRRTGRVWVSDPAVAWEPGGAPAGRGGPLRVPVVEEVRVP
ncbi:DUF1972 domain-containing protein [Kocuria sp. M1R5S2]|uniref:DUF1972 domain-containing protein n=1 Tax=Kocuria rhizosphaerae TaxID=3376285 RepID=UPI0037AAE11B